LQVKSNLFIVIIQYYKMLFINDIDRINKLYWREHKNIIFLFQASKELEFELELHYWE